MGNRCSVSHRRPQVTSAQLLHVTSSSMMNERLDVDRQLHNSTTSDHGGAVPPSRRDDDDPDMEEAEEQEEVVDVEGKTKEEPSSQWIRAQPITVGRVLATSKSSSGGRQLVVSSSSVSLAPFVTPFCGASDAFGASPTTSSSPAMPKHHEVRDGNEHHHLRTSTPSDLLAGATQQHCPFSNPDLDAFLGGGDVGVRMLRFAPMNYA